MPVLSQASSRVQYTQVKRIPIRQNLLAPDGTVHRIPINLNAPDAHSIIGALQFVVEQFGRDPWIRQFAIQLLSSRRNNDVQGHARVLIQWVKSHMIYLADPDGAEFIQTPTVLLNVIAAKGTAYGDCDDHVVLLGALLTAIGIPARAAAVKLYGSEYYNHVIIEYQVNGEWVTCDPCAKGVPTPNYNDRLVAV